MTFIDSQNEMNDPGSDQWLSVMLASWEAPPRSPELDRRVMASFRDHFDEVSLPAGALAQSPMIFEVNHMKICESCHEEFSDQFAFCPLDGAPLASITNAAADGPDFVITEITAESGFAAPGSEAYHLTLLDDAGLVARLTGEMREVAQESRLTWPEFRRDPKGFAGRSLVAYGAMVKRGLSNPNVGFSIAAAFALVIAIIVGLILVDQRHAQLVAMNRSDDLELQSVVDIPDTQPTPEPGHAGMNKGKGGGSNETPSKPSGGGGGGRNELDPVSQGKLAPANLNFPIIVAPNPKPPPPTNDPLVVPLTMDADPSLMPPDKSSANFGDPNSKTTATSSGPGSGNGMGNGNGAGTGNGNGGGYGPGNGGNTGGGDNKLGGGGPGGPGGVDYNKVFKTSEVTQKVHVLSKPQPEYTEEARKAQTIGTVRLSVVFSSTGQVLNIRPMNQLPNGLTERAINAARRIQFTPAIKDGHPVSSYMVIEYNFNIY
jgi:hypothetical protein